MGSHQQIQVTAKGRKGARGKAHLVGAAGTSSGPKNTTTSTTDKKEAGRDSAIGRTA